MKFTSFNEFSIVSLCKLLKGLMIFTEKKCLKIYLGTVRNSQKLIFAPKYAKSAFTTMKYLRAGSNRAFFVLIGGFALFFKEMGFTHAVSQMCFKF